MGKIAERAVSSAKVGRRTGPVSKETERIEAIAAAMQQHGPLSVPRLVELTGWSRQTVSTQLMKSTDRFEKVSDHVCAVGGSVPATYYLADAECEMDEDELERRADEMCRSYAGWPAIDHALDAIVGQMVRGSIHEMRGV
jgi:hypothetical protein